VARERLHQTQEVKSMAVRKMLDGLALLALGVGVLAPVATAFPTCGHRAWQGALCCAP